MACTRVRRAYRVLVGKPEGQRPVGRPRSTLDDNIKMYLQETSWEGMEYINMAHDDRCRTLVDAAMNLRVHKVRGIF